MAQDNTSNHYATLGAGFRHLSFETSKWTVYNKDPMPLVVECHAGVFERFDQCQWEVKNKSKRFGHIHCDTIDYQTRQWYLKRRTTFPTDLSTATEPETN